MDRTLRSPPLASQVSRIKPTGLLCVGMDEKKLVYSAKVATRDALLGRILDAADHIRNSELKLLRAARAVHNRAATCDAAGDGIFQNQL